MFTSPYLRWASKRLHNNTLNYRDCFYRELFRFHKDLNSNSISVSSGEFEYIIHCYDRTIADKKEYFCLYDLDHIYCSYSWLLYCLKVLKINTLSFQNLADRTNFLSNLQGEDGYFPILFIEGKEEVFNATDTTFYDSLFGKISDKR